MSDATARPTPLRYIICLAVLLWAWCGTVLVVNLPGHLTHDSLTQIAEGRRGIVESWNPIFSSWIFGRLTVWSDSTEFLVLASVSMLATALLLLVGSSRRGHLWSLIPTAALLFAPVMLVYPGIVWKDVWFAHLALLGFGLVVLRSTGAGWWSEVLAVVLLAAGALSRQTGMLVALAGVVALALSAPKFRLTGLVVRVAALLVAAATLGGIARESMHQVNGREVGTGFRLVAMFDIAGMLQRLPQAELTRLRREGFDMAEWEEAARATFSGERIDLLDQRPIRGPRDLSMGLVLGQWADLVLAHPATYAAHRLNTYAWFGGLEQQSRCLPVHVGLESSAVTPQAGLRQQASRWSSTLYAYSRHFVDTPYFAPLAWSLVSLLLLAYYAWRGCWRHPLAWLQVAGLLYSLSYLMAGLSCDFRYSYFSVLCASIGLMRVCADGLSLPRSEHA